MVTLIMNTELKYKDVIEKIIGASFEVHKFLENGFQEFWGKESWVQAFDT